MLCFAVTILHVSVGCMESFYSYFSRSFIIDIWLSNENPCASEVTLRDVIKGNRTKPQQNITKHEPCAYCLRLTLQHIPLFHDLLHTNNDYQSIIWKLLIHAMIHDSFQDFNFLYTNTEDRGLFWWHWALLKVVWCCTFNQYWRLLTN